MFSVPAQLPPFKVFPSLSVPRVSFSLFLLKLVLPSPTSTLLHLLIVTFIPYLAPNGPTAQTEPSRVRALKAATRVQRGSCEERFIVLFA